MVDFNYIMYVTPRKRASIIALRKHTGLSIRNIFEKLAIPKSTVGDIIKRAKDTGEPQTLQHGKKRKTTLQDVKVMINSVKNSKKTSKDLQRDLALSWCKCCFFHSPTETP